MKKAKANKLIKSGWKVSDAKELLDISDEEMRLIETKRALIRLVREVRATSKITREKLAEMINSSQSRIAKMEAASPDVSLDLVFRALFAMGVSKMEVARVIDKVS
jgi:DNA-binding XRE family transcriptional regulator